MIAAIVTVWALGVLFAWSLCVVAKRADEAMYGEDGP